MQLLKKLTNRGDTIIEVFICMAIVSFALGTAYGITRRSLIQVRVAEERTQALKIAEQQIQRLKQYIAANPTTAFSAFPTPAGDCLLNNGASIKLLTDLPAQSPVLSPTDSRCAVDQNGSFDYDDGTPTGGNVDSLYPYRAGFTYLPSTDGKTHTFYVFAGRLTASGNTNSGNTAGLDVVTLIYRQSP